MDSSVVISACPVQCLLEKLADPNVVDALSRETPLIEAACRGDEAMCRLLLRFRANVAHESAAGITALTFAESEKHAGIAKLLREEVTKNGADSREDGTKSAKPRAQQEQHQPQPQDEVDSGGIGDARGSSASKGETASARLKALQEECLEVGVPLLPWCDDEHILRRLLLCCRRLRTTSVEDLRRKCAARQIPHENIAHSECIQRLLQRDIWKNMPKEQLRAACAAKNVSTLCWQHVGPGNWIRNDTPIRKQLVTKLVERTFGMWEGSDSGEDLSSDDVEVVSDGKEEEEEDNREASHAFPSWMKVESFGRHDSKSRTTPNSNFRTPMGTFRVQAKAPSASMSFTGLGRGRGFGSPGVGIGGKGGLAGRMSGVRPTRVAMPGATGSGWLPPHLAGAREMGGGVWSKPRFEKPPAAGLFGPHKPTRPPAPKARPRTRSDRYYETLGVKPGARAGEVRRAYLKLALQHHPDKNQGSVEAASKFREITEAYESLCKMLPGLSSA